MDYLFFYGQEGKHGFLSQFYRSRFTDDEGNAYFCCEQWMMVNKAKLFLEKFPRDNQKIIDKMLRSTSPAEIKKLGRAVRGFKEKEWKKNRVQIVYQGNLMKFSQNEGLKQKLLETGYRYLVEAAANDPIWGIGYSVQDAPNTDESQWGENLLGRVLMQVRADLITQELEQDVVALGQDQEQEEEVDEVGT